MIKSNPQSKTQSPSQHPSQGPTESQSVIRPLEMVDLKALKTFTDHAIGTGYYTMAELEEIYNKSLDQKTKTMTTLVLLQDGKICGVRITYPPGNWSHGKGKGLNPKLWPYPLEQTAYFQSLFVAPELTGTGLGKKLSLKAIEILKSIHAKGIVCHSWVESPHDSSGKYLRSLGFQSIAKHTHYWKEVDYQCTRCGSPCLCTAEEMYLDLTRKAIL